MRILMLGPHPAARGPLPKHTPLLVAALRRLGCEVTLMPWGRRRDDESQAEKILSRLRDLLRIRRALRRARYDLFIVKTGHDFGTLNRDILVLLAARPLCPRLIVQFHGSFPTRFAGRGWVDRLFTVASGMLVTIADGSMLLSSQEQWEWQAAFPWARFDLVDNPFLPSPERQVAALRDHVDGHVPSVLFVGRLIRPKGIFELIEAMPRVLAERHCRFVLAGDGGELAAVRERIAALDLAEHVTLAGYLEGEALAAAYRTADVFVLPSWSEGFSFAVAEAMDAGLPVVTTRIRGMADHLEPEVHALFVPPRDPDAIAAAINRLLADPALRERMGRANREKIQAFLPDAVGRRYLAVLRSLVGIEEPGVGRQHTCAG